MLLRYTTFRSNRKAVMRKLFYPIRLQIVPNGSPNTCETSKFQLANELFLKSTKCTAGVFRLGKSSENYKKAKCC